MKTLAELFMRVVQLVEQGKYTLLDTTFNPLHMTTSEQVIHLAEDYLIYLYMSDHSALDKKSIQAIIKVPELEGNLEVQSVISTSTFQELTSLVSPEAEKSTKWSALETDLSKSNLEAELDRARENKRVLSNTNLEINHYGAVYTSDVLVDLILDKLDQIHRKQNAGVSIFADPEMTICDPASGSGSFLLCSKIRLVHEQPKRTEADVVNQQLFGSEIQKKQQVISKKILNYKNRPEVQPNINLGDSLKFDFWNRKF